jgi:hypothetical protein
LTSKPPALNLNTIQAGRLQLHRGVGWGHIQATCPFILLYKRQSPSFQTPPSACCAVLLQNLVTKVIDIDPQPLTPELLARAPELADDVGLQLIKLFKAKGVINASGLLTDDPRRSNWRAIIRESGTEGAQQPWLHGESFKGSCMVDTSSSISY